MPGRGEVWLVDLGMVEKVRPAVVLSGACQANDRDMRMDFWSGSKLANNACSKMCSARAPSATSRFRIGTCAPRNVLRRAALPLGCAGGM